VECFTNIVYIHIKVEYYINKMLKYTPVVQSLDCFTKPFQNLITDTHMRSIRFILS